MTDASGLQAVEFFGLPGAGKTTLAEQVVAGLRKRGYPVVSSRDWMGDGRSFAVRTSRRLAMVLRETLTRPSLLLRDGLRVVAESSSLKEGLHSGWNQLSVSAMVCRSKRTGPLLILDQGPVQAAWTTALRQEGKHQDTALDRIDAGWLRRSLFVQVVTPAEQARIWLSKRGDRTSRLQRPGEIDNPALWSRGTDLMHALGERLHQRLLEQGIANHLLRLSSTDGPAEELADKVITHFSACYRDKGVQTP